MNTPFNTGKVAIGSRYERPLRVEMSRDMERLQRGLLEQRLEKRAASAFTLLWVLVLGLLGVLWMVR